MEFCYENNRMKGRIILCDNLHTKRKWLQDRTLYKFIRVLEGQLLLEVDDQQVGLRAGEILTLTHLHHLRFLAVEGKYTALLFNSNFYCIYGNDHEVSCNGVLFHGSSCLVKFAPGEHAAQKLNILTGIFQDEFAAYDQLQEEMLRILLKRYIILCTRLVRRELGKEENPGRQLDMVRKFYVLVETHFREKKQVQEYADLLNKSPKTLYHVLSQYQQPSPIRIIQQRVEAEAKRLLIYTSKSAKEIALVLGFEEQAAFARFFKNAAGISCTEFRKNHKKTVQREKL